MSDDLLYVHMRAGISLFRRLLKDQFDEDLTDLLPGRVIPVSSTPPSDLGLLVENELSDIKALVATGRRRSAEAAARLRPLLSLDGSATGRTDQPTMAEVGKAERSLRAGVDWRRVLPGLARLSIGPAEPGGDLQEVVLRIGKADQAVPVRRAKAGEEGALAYRGVSPFEEFGTKLTEYGPKLGVSLTEGYAIIDALKIKDDDLAYFVKLTPAGNVTWQGLSARALELGRQALANNDFDLAAAKLAYRQTINKKRGHRYNQSGKVKAINPPND